VKEIDLDVVFKPERLIDKLDAAIKTAVGPTVLFVDRLEAVAGDEGLFRSQMAAIMRWFLDTVAGKPGLACVLGVSSAGALDAALTRSPLLPRHLSIPPPDANRRALLFEAALARVPTADLDYEQLAARTAGFSGADIMAAVVHASALVATNGGPVTPQLVGRAIEETTPSLGTVQPGEVPSYGFERVANLDDVKRRLTEAVIWPVTQPERFERLGIEPPRGLLLYGPPGTGKTFVIRALAHESGAAFFAVKGAELLDKYVGESERGVREVFARARAAAPSILFFDELDALAPVRGTSTTSVTDSVVAALLTEMDGVSDRGDVVVIGATNRRDLIDPALLRSGRFETHLELGLPGVEGRRALLGITDVPVADDVDLDDLARATDGLSFADLTGMLREAALNALRRDPSALAVTGEDLRLAIERING
jgi:transitional endoplasmic reticulum ATPase